MLSVIVAAYNVEPYIKRCLDSLVEQTIEDYEIIVVNDQSTDGTLNVIEAFAEKYDNIRIVDKKSNEGLSEARNSGIKIAKGKYCAFVDGDDFVEKDTYQCCCELAEKMYADEVVFESVCDKKNGEQVYMPVRSSKDVYSTEEEMKLYFKEKIGAKPKNPSDYEIGFSPWGRIYRLSVLRDNNIEFISERKYIYEDLVFAMRVAKYIRRAAILHRVFYHYCENENSLTRKVDLNRYYRVKTMCQYIQHLEIYKQYESDSDFLERYHRTILGFIRWSIMQLGSVDDKEHIKMIVQDELCTRVLQKYPIHKLPIKQRIFAFLLKHRCYVLLYCMVKFYR
jgi:glycosyltransferase involved in cell wall biosynthesis